MNFTSRSGWVAKKVPLFNKIIIDILSAIHPLFIKLINIKNMRKELINYFKVAITSGTKVDPIELNKKALPCGYMIHPDCCNEHTKAFVDGLSHNINSTFYKTWEDVVSKSREEIFIDQWIHYASTYGMDFESKTYIPNDGTLVEYNTYTVITPISDEDLYNKCLDVIYSGIALNKFTLNIICDHLISNYSHIDVDSIKNRDAKIIICDALNIRPSSPDELFKYIYYKITGNPMVIKSKEVIFNMSYNDGFDWRCLNEDELMLLAQVFNRHKKLFMAAKQTSNHKYASVINKIARYSKYLHKPYKKGFWETALTEVRDINSLQLKAENLSNFKIIALIGAINDRMATMQNIYHKSLHIIRNGKVFINDPKYKYNMKYYYECVKQILLDQLSLNLKHKACIVRFPKNLHLVCPMSEKQFVGNIPFGSRFDMGENNYIGIYWRNEWGARDLDLSLRSFDGTKYGWNGSYTNKDNSVIYSGDMTNADPEATEILACRGKYPNSLIYVNRYFGEEGSKYKLFFGSQPLEMLSKNYMVDPNTIRFEEMMVSEGREQALGYIKNNSVYFINLTTSNQSVSKYQPDILKCMERKLDTYVDLKSVLLNAGFIEYDEKIHNKIDLDLQDLKKDTLISLFS